DVGRACLGELSRLRCVRASAKRSGNFRAANTEHSRRIRSARHGTEFTRDAAYHDRGKEARVGRPCEVLCRSCVRKGSPRRIAVEKISGGTKKIDRPKSRGKTS